MSGTAPISAAPVAPGDAARASSQPPLILASRSPHRAALLARLLHASGLTFTVASADIDETPKRAEMPLAYVTRIARSKAAQVAASHPGHVVLAADTPVIVGRRILQTPADEAEARAMLQLQSGRKVHVPTVVAMVLPDGKSHHLVAENWLKFKVFSPTDLTTMLRAGHWQGCSGGIQIDDGKADAYLKTMHGSISGIIGLPLYHTARLLRRAGYTL